MSIDINIVWDAIQYGNLLLDGRVTEAGFRMLFKDFLHERGALPVGEIGKMLQDSTGITTLSTSLKLKFGGLKKFLEKYPEYFVIGVNHPFNPHVYLKETLQAEDVQAISRGEIPKSVLMKFKKVQKEIVRRKKAGLTVSGAGCGVSAPIAGSTTNLPPNIVAITPSPGSKPVVVAVGPTDVHGGAGPDDGMIPRIPAGLSTNQPGIGKRTLVSSTNNRDAGVIAVSHTKSRQHYDYYNNNNHIGDNNVMGSNYGSTPPSLSKHHHQQRHQQQHQQYKRSNSAEQNMMNPRDGGGGGSISLQRHTIGGNVSHAQRYDSYQHLQQQQPPPSMQFTSPQPHRRHHQHQYQHQYQQQQPYHHHPHQQHQQHGHQHQQQQRSTSVDSFVHPLSPPLLEHQDLNQMDYNNMVLNLDHKWTERHAISGHEDLGINLDIDASMSSTSNFAAHPHHTDTPMGDESSQNASFLSKILGRNL